MRVGIAANASVAASGKFKTSKARSIVSTVM
jgi:hypothetical protein